MSAVAAVGIDWNEGLGGTVHGVDWADTPATSLNEDGVSTASG